MTTQKFTLTSLDSIKMLAKKPIKATIGTDSEAFFRKLTMDEFFAVQDRLASVDTKTTELEAKKEVSDSDRAKEVANFSQDVIADLMIDTMTDEEGNPAFKKEDRNSLRLIVSPGFVKDFIEALLGSQGVDKKGVASAEASFQEK